MTIICSRRTLLSRSVLVAAATALPSSAALALPPGATQTVETPDDPNFWYRAFLQTTLTSLTFVPGAGGILSGFAAFLLPASIGDPADSRWKSYVEAINKIVDEKIDNAIYDSVRAHLTGITNLLRTYKGALETGDGKHLRSTEISMNVHMQGVMPQFTKQGPLYRLLPLFVPAANIHLGLLRQAAQRARLEGEGAIADDFSQQLEHYIDSYTRHYDDVVAGQLKKVVDSHPHDHNKQRSQPWAAALALKSNDQMRHGDLHTCWPYFSERRYPGRVRPRLDRELFTPLFGSYHDCTLPFPSTLPSHGSPKGLITSVQMGGHNYVDGVKLHYAPGQGPDGATSTVIGGNGGTWTDINDVIARKHIVAVEVGSGFAVNRIRLTFGDGTQSPWIGGGRPSDGSTLHTFDGHRLSSVMGFGTAAGYGGVLSGCVFGFQLQEMEASQTLSEPVRQHLEAVWPMALATL